MQNYTRAPALQHVARKLAAEVTYIMVVKMDITDENDPWWNTVNKLSKAFNCLRSNNPSRAAQLVEDAIRYIPSEEGPTASQRLAAIRQSIIHTSS